MRVISYIFRFFHRVHPAYRDRYAFRGMAISRSEVHFVKQRLAILAQKYYFAEEYRSLINQARLPSNRPLIPSNPILDSDGVIRLNGRLCLSPTLSYSERHPILLPYGCRFFRLLTEFIHLISIHGGNQLMLRILRIEYWVPRMKTKIRAVVHRCKTCLIDRKCVSTQIMAAFG